MSTVKVGAKFPSLVLFGKGNAQVRVPEDFHGKSVVLSWFPFAFSPVCTEELTGFAKVHGEMEHLNATVVAVSVDHWYSNEAYRISLGASYPFLSDWFRDNARKLGILNEERGMAKRVIYLLDQDGILRWQREYATKDCPKVEHFLGELRRLAPAAAQPA